VPALTGLYRGIDSVGLSYASSLSLLSLFSREEINREEKREKRERS
jgi:hypothetical protein